MTKQQLPKVLTIAIITACGTIPMGCRDLGNNNISFRYEFVNNAEGWEGGFADYPVGSEVFYELEWSWDSLPDPFVGRKGLHITGNNHSDDLFMYIRREIVGLKANSRYSLVFKIEFATDADSGCAGVGGPPGEGVGMKVGATRYRPIAEVSYEGLSDWFRMNIDHGAPSSGGADAVRIGNIANTQTDCGQVPLYELKRLNNSSHPFEITSDGSGKFWVIVGTDSGFEGKTSLYYTRVEIIAELI